MLTGGVVIGLVVIAYVAITFPTRRRRRQWEKVKKDPKGPPIDFSL
jgi:type II secretory pathway component PulM